MRTKEYNEKNIQIKSWNINFFKRENAQYIKREKNKPKPEGVDFWNFNCKFGKNNEEAIVIDFIDITKNIDQASAEDWEALYIWTLFDITFWKFTF